MKIIRIINFISIVFFATSCMTFKNKHELIPVVKEDPIIKVEQFIENKCRLAKTPQFLAHFSSETMHLPPIEIEGIWEKNFSILKSSVVGPLGTEYFSFQLDGSNITYSSDQKISASNEYFEQFATLFSKIGAQGIRAFLCGEYAFQRVNKNDGIYVVKNTAEQKDNLNNQEALANNENAFDKNKYFSISTTDLSGTKLEVQSYVAITPKAEGYGVAINSRFYYGIFSSDSQIEVKWVGYVSHSLVLPTSVVFKSKEHIFSILFSDYQ